MSNNKKLISGTAPLLSPHPSPPRPNVSRVPTAPHTPAHGDPTVSAFQSPAAPVGNTHADANSASSGSISPPNANHVPFNIKRVARSLSGGKNQLEAEEAKAAEEANPASREGTVGTVTASPPSSPPSRTSNPGSLRVSTIGNTIKEKRNINKQIEKEEEEEEKLDQEMADMLIVDPTNMTAIEYFTDDDVYRDYCIKMNEYLNDNTEKYLEEKGFLESLLIDLPDISPAVNHLLEKFTTKEKAEELIDRYEYLFILTKSVKFDYLFYQILDDYFLQNTNKTKYLRRVLKNIYTGPEKMIFDPVITEFHLSMLLKQPEKVIID